MTFLPIVTEFFGTPDSLRRHILGMLHNGLSCEQPDRLAEAANSLDLSNPSVLLALQRGVEPPELTSDDVLSLAGLLELPIEDLMPLWPGINPEQQARLEALWAATSGAPEASESEPEKRGYELELWLRFQTLETLFPKPV